MPYWGNIVTAIGFACAAFIFAIPDDDDEKNQAGPVVFSVLMLIALLFFVAGILEFMSTL